MKKYKLTNKTMTITRNGKEVILCQIEALRDFVTVKSGDKGGFIEKESNLSQDGNCWIYDNAKVYGNSKVCGNSHIM